MNWFSEASWLFLQTEAAQVVLAQLSLSALHVEGQLGIATQLRRSFSAEQTHALLETAMLRQKAANKFSRANQLYFDRPSLEMSSAEIIAHYRAQRYAPFRHITDLCCACGADSFPLVADHEVVGVDWSTSRSAMAIANTAAYGAEGRFTASSADVTTMPLWATDALFFDPARRDEQGNRLHHLAQYRPPIATLHRWSTITPHWGAKVSPAIAYSELPQEAHCEFISVGGDLREGVLWWGGLRPPAKRTATLLTGLYRAEMCDQLDSEMEDETEQLPISSPQAYLYEPDPAVIRAQLVQTCGKRVGACLLDPHIAYLTADRPITSPFIRGWPILDAFPFQLKHLRSYLRTRGIGRLTIKKRGSPLDVAWLENALRLKGSESALLHLTRLGETPFVIITAPQPL